jgi:hypothetical protein
MNSHFPTDPNNPHRLPVGLDLGDWTEWTTEIEKTGSAVTAKVVYQIRYAPDAGGNIGFSLYPVAVDGVGIDLSNPLKMESGKWIVGLKTGVTCKIPGL